MFFKIGVPKNFAILTGKHLCWSLFLIRLQAFRLQNTFLYRTPLVGCLKKQIRAKVVNLLVCMRLVTIICRQIFQEIQIVFLKNIYALCHYTQYSILTTNSLMAYFSCNHDFSVWLSSICLLKNSQSHPLIGGKLNKKNEEVTKALLSIIE